MKIRLLLGVVLNANFWLIKLRQRQATKPLANILDMDIIFLDTSIFVANNFLEGNRIKSIYRLAKNKEIKVILPQLVFDEIINQVKKNIDDAENSFKKNRNRTKVLRNIPSLASKFDLFDNAKAKEKLIELIKDKFEESNFEIIDYPTINIQEVFQSYFNHNFPFSNGIKKNEFPDAFALKTIELWAE